VGHEAAAAAKAIRANLIADVTLAALITTSGTVKVFAESAPQDATLPYVVFRQRSPGEDSQVINPRRVMTSPLVDVGVWVEGNPYSATAQSAAKRIDVVLGSLGGYSVTDANSDTWEVSARREGGAWVREEVDPKTMVKFYWVGGSYRLSISAA
jgi:predicted membrane-bound mannosyltransferase